MGLLDVNLAERTELRLLDDNTEAELQISRADITPNRSDPSRSNLALVFDVPAEPDVDDIRVWIPIPTDDQREQDPKRHAKAMIRLEQFLQAFDIQPPIETEEMVGKTGWALVAEDEDQNGNPVNTVRRFMPKR